MSPEATALRWQVGMSRTDITAWEPRQMLFGWGVDESRAHGISSRLHARVLVARDDRGGAIGFACLDLGFISSLLREAVLEDLATRWPDVGLDRQNVMLVATHTHSAPGGISDSPLYEMLNYGISPGVLTHIVQRTSDALAEAWRSAVPGRLRLGAVEVPVGERIAFNRSLRAYNANLDVLQTDDPEAAVDRRLTVLRVEDAEGRERGAVCWFPSHGTSIHGGKVLIHPDHKGLAASMLEAKRRPTCPDYVAIFAQGAAGDVTPNFRWSETRGLSVGVTDDDDANAAWVAERQVIHAERALAEARRAPPMEGAITGRVRNADLADTAIHPRFSRGQEQARTRPARLATGFMTGTPEGPGPFGAAARLIRLAGRLKRRVRLERARLQPHTVPWADDVSIPIGEIHSGVHGRFMGLALTRVLPIASRLDASFAWIAGAHAATGTLGRPWVSGRMPAQLLFLGAFVVVGVPSEPTTVAGRRLAATVGAALGRTSHGQIQVAGYANAYAGYITTWEEYQLQNYEGSSTFFGPWTLAAWQMAFHDLARQDSPTSMVPGPALEVVDMDTLVEERERGRAGMGRFASRVAEQREGRVHGRLL